MSSRITSVPPKLRRKLLSIMVEKDVYNVVKSIDVRKFYTKSGSLDASTFLDHIHAISIRKFPTKFYCHDEFSPLLL